MMETEAKTGESVDTVLLADDDPDMVKALSLFFRLEGIEVITAEDGVTALRQVMHRSPSVVLLDIELPKLNGLDFCRGLRRNIGDLETPVVVFSGFTEEKWRTSMLEAGADEYVTKPCDPKRLLEVVTRLSRAKARSASAAAAPRAGLPG